MKLGERSGSAWDVFLCIVTEERHTVSISKKEQMPACCTGVRLGVNAQSLHCGPTTAMPMDTAVFSNTE